MIFRKYISKQFYKILEKFGKDSSNGDKQANTHITLKVDNSKLKKIYI